MFNSIMESSFIHVILTSRSLKLNRERLSNQDKHFIHQKYRTNKNKSIRYPKHPLKLMKDKEVF